MCVCLKRPRTDLNYGTDNQRPAMLPENLAKVANQFAQYEFKARQTCSTMSTGSSSEVNTKKGISIILKPY